MNQSPSLSKNAAQFYDGIYGFVLPLLFLFSLLLCAQAGMSFLQRYQGQIKKLELQKTENAHFLHPERSLFLDGERYDVMAVREGKSSISREVLIRQASSGQIRSYSIGDRLFAKGPFVAAVEVDRVLFWLDGRTRKIFIKP